MNERALVPVPPEKQNSPEWMETVTKYCVKLYNQGQACRCSFHKDNGRDAWQWLTNSGEWRISNRQRNRMVSEGLIDIEDNCDAQD